MAEWLTDLLSGRPGCDRELVERYTHGLLALARRQLPDRVRARVDPEDVVQSVYRSFFKRLHEGRFAFDESHDVWRLLAAMTYHKARNAAKFHLRDRRDARRELTLAGSETPAGPPEEAGAGDVDLLYECLEQLLARLPENYRDIVVRRLDGQSIEEVAGAVRRSRRTVLRVLAHVQELAARELEGET